MHMLACLARALMRTVWALCASPWGFCAALPRGGGREGGGGGWRQRFDPWILAGILVRVMAAFGVGWLGHPTFRLDAFRVLWEEIDRGTGIGWVGGLVGIRG
jgi:hypothetical protein